MRDRPPMVIRAVLRFVTMMVSKKEISKKKKKPPPHTHTGSLVLILFPKEPAVLLFWDLVVLDKVK